MFTQNTRFWTWVCYFLGLCLWATEGRCRLRWRSAPVKNVRGTKQYEWLWIRVLTNRVLHYNQDFFNGEFVSRATSNPHTRNLSSKELQLEALFLNYFSISSAVPTVTSNNLVVGSNSWPTGALLHSYSKPTLTPVTWSRVTKEGHITKGLISILRDGAPQNTLSSLNAFVR
jgi:hypothetical protein